MACQAPWAAHVVRERHSDVSRVAHRWQRGGGAALVQRRPHGGKGGRCGAQVVLVVRGTTSLADALTDLTGHLEAFDGTTVSAFLGGPRCVMAQYRGFPRDMAPCRFSWHIWRGLPGSSASDHSRKDLFGDTETD